MKINDTIDATQLPINAVYDDRAGDGGYCSDVLDSQAQDEYLKESSDLNFTPVDDFTQIEQQAIAWTVMGLTAYEAMFPMTSDPVLVTTPRGQQIPISQSFVLCNEEVGEITTAMDKAKHDEDDSKIEEIRLDENYYAISGKLIEDTNIHGHYFAYNTKATFYPNHAFKSGTLLEDAELLPDIWFKAETEATYYDNESLKTKATFYSGYLRDSKEFLLGDDEFFINCRPGQKVCFHKNGEFKRTRLNQATQIDDIWFAQNTDIEFYDNGALLSGYLERPRTFNHIEFAVGTKVVFYKSGEFKGAILPHKRSFDSRYGKLNLAPQSWMTCNKNRQIVEGTLFNDKEIHYSLHSGETIKLTCLGHQIIKFHDDGSEELKLKECVIKHDVVIDDIVYRAGSTLKFHENGRVAYGTVKFSVEFDNPHLEYPVIVKKGGGVSFYEDGNLSGCDPLHDLELRFLDDDERPVVIDGNFWVNFHETGYFENGRLKGDDVRVRDFLLKENKKIRFTDQGLFHRGTLAQDKLVYQELYGDLFCFKAGEEVRIEYQSRGREVLRGYLKYPVEYTVNLAGEDISFTMPEGGKIKFRVEDGSVKGGILKERTRILSEYYDDLYFAQGEWFQFGEDDGKQYVGGVLDKDINIDGHKLKKGMLVNFYTSGYVQGYDVQDKFEPCPEDHPGLFLGDDNWVEFYDVADFEQNEEFPGMINVKGGILVEEYDPFPELYESLWLAPKDWVAFGTDGTLRGGRLLEDTYVDWPGFENLVFKEETWMKFHKDGTIRGGTLLEDAYYDHSVYGEIVLKAGTWMELHKDGTFKGGVLKEPVSIINPVYGPVTQEDVVLRQDHWIEFFDDSLDHGLKSGTLDENFTVPNLTVGSFEIAKGFTASFHPIQTLEYGSLTKETRLYGIWFRGDCEGHEKEKADSEDNAQISKCDIELSEQEYLMGGYVAEEYSFSGKKYRFGEWLEIEDIWHESEE